MARQPRLDVPGVAQHVIQRGNDRQACFASTADHARYRQELLEASLRFGCSVHSYVLMTNHVHILVTPAERGAVSRMMQAIGRRYVAGFNARYRRTGTLWEGRFKAGLVAGERYVLTCYRYIELNPVRADMVVTPEDHAWSSFGANALGRHDPLVTPHPVYLSLAASTQDRRAAYRELFRAPPDPAAIDDLRTHTHQQKVWGSDGFRAEIETLTQRAAGVRPRGRPPASPGALK